MGNSVIYLEEVGGCSICRVTSQDSPSCNPIQVSCHSTDPLSLRNLDCSDNYSLLSSHIEKMLLTWFCSMYWWTKPLTIMWEILLPLPCNGNIHYIVPPIGHPRTVSCLSEQDRKVFARVVISFLGRLAFASTRLLVFQPRRALCFDVSDLGYEWSRTIQVLSHQGKIRSVPLSFRCIPGCSACIFSKFFDMSLQHRLNRALC